METNPIIQINNLSAGYDGKIVIEDVNLTIYENDFLGIIGPNGGGKTTLLRTLLGLLSHTQRDNTNKCNKHYTKWK